MQATQRGRTLGKTGISLHAFLFMIYFLLAPMEDILNSSAGTLVKYLAILIIGAGIIENHGKLPIVRSTENKCIIWLMLVSVASVLWSIDRATTTHRIVTYLLLPGFCIYSSTLSFSKKEFEKIVTAAIIGGVIASFVAFRSGNMLNEQMASRMVLTEENDPNNFAAFLLLPFTLMWWRFQEYEKRGYRILYVLGMALLALIILMTGSRGALVSAIMMFIVYYIATGKIKRASAILGGAIILVVLLFVMRRFLPTDLVLRLFSITNYTSGGAGRTAVWGIVLQNIVPEMGALGLGAGCVSLRLTGFYGFAKGVHNTYLNMFCEFGILGLPAFIIMLVSLFKHTMEKKFYIGIALLACICTTIFFLDSYAKKYFWNVILLLFVFHGIETQDESGEQYS